MRDTWRALVPCAQLPSDRGPQLMQQGAWRPPLAPGGCLGPGVGLLTWLGAEGVGGPSGSQEHLPGIHCLHWTGVAQMALRCSLSQALGPFPSLGVCSSLALLARSWDTRPQTRQGAQGVPLPHLRQHSWAWLQTPARPKHAPLSWPLCALSSKSAQAASMALSPGTGAVAPGSSAEGSPQLAVATLGPWGQSPCLASPVALPATGSPWPAICGPFLSPESGWGPSLPLACLPSGPGPLSCPCLCLLLAGTPGPPCGQPRARPRQSEGGGCLKPARSCGPHPTPTPGGPSVTPRAHPTPHPEDPVSPTQHRYL